ncbi:hypothetical protein A0J57_04850 [Sphingobium sp. 22B]|uniref:hypothetical protein n=1 Tax=unclassified Sphingobium TaxID=2611147 RepID=UPI00078177D9|nr:MULTISPECIES: hypothetical protein [unclassified Sphingobium]KXU31060.1 hypothetical protein AXW74_14490 [Sphingobium sp. AM]KYC33447.1 hypothetical protein A0J57_04850 [Sphingobium sp. 22B]OAP32629.1 hypothetical protein A8O16_06970 [Sphingobium sp. 20006FA]
MNGEEIASGFTDSSVLVTSSFIGASSSEDLRQNSMTRRSMINKDERRRRLAAKHPLPGMIKSGRQAA